MGELRLSAREGRIFALTLAAGFAVVGVVLALRGMRAAGEVLAVAAVAAAITGLVVPRRLGPIRAAWLRFGEAIGRVTTPIILGVIYIVVVTPLAVTRRLLRRAPAVPATYWRPHEADKRKERLQRQF